MRQTQAPWKPGRVFRGGLRRGALLLATVPLLAGTLLAGCSATAPAGLNTALTDTVSERGLNPKEVLVPFQLSPEMEVWAREAVPGGIPKDQKVDRLLDALLHLEGLNLQYRADYTGTAQEVFERRTANCLSFTHLFVAMARSLGLDAYFLKIDEIQSFAQEGELVIHAGHITAAAGPPSAPRILEFSEVRDAGYKRVTRISDLRAISLFYSNRGAEYLRQNRVEEAVWWLERAVVLDPEEPDSWVNLGVARRWSGNDELAEASYRRALEIDPETLSAYHNLASLYRRQGKEEAVEALLALTDRRDNRNPFTYLELGDLSLNQGDLEAAERFYRRALRLDRELAGAHAALGLVAVDDGRPRYAKRLLEKARRIDPGDPRVQRLGISLGFPPAPALAADPASSHTIQASKKALKLGLGGKQ